MVDWRWTGYNALIYLGRDAGDPEGPLRVGGDRRRQPWRQFWRITVPMLQPTIIFVVIISTIGGMQLFTEPLLFGGSNISGGTLRQFQTITMYMYENALREPPRSSATAPAIAWTAVRDDRGGLAGQLRWCPPDQVDGGG